MRMAAQTRHRIQSRAVGNSRRDRGTTPISTQSLRAVGRLFLVTMLGIHLYFLWGVRGRIAQGDPDFTVYYTAAKMLREGRASQLYDLRGQQAVQREFTTDSDLRSGPLPYIHPPFEALLFVPLTSLAYRDAFVLWNVINLGLLLGIGLLLRPSLAVFRKVPIAEWVLAFLAFFPVFTNFLQGQDSILLLLLFVLAFRALDRDADFLAGCWLGLAVFKYHFVIPLILILAIWRGRKVALAFAATATAATLLSLAIVGWHEALQYPAFAWRVVSTPGHGQTPLGLTPNLLGLITGWPRLEDIGWLRWLVLAGSVGLLMVGARMRDLANDRRLFHLSFACAVIISVLVGYNTNAHDLSLLVLPIALAADHCLAVAPRWTWERARMVVPIVPLLVSPIWFFLWMRWGQTNLMAAFLLWWLWAVRQEILRTRKGQGVTSQA